MRTSFFVIGVMIVEVLVFGAFFGHWVSAAVISGFGWARLTLTALYWRATPDHFRRRRKPTGTDI
jgi:hypothetical protein